MPDETPAPKQNKALAGGGAASLGVGGASGGMLGVLIAPFLNRALEGTGISLDESWYSAFGTILTVGLQLLSTKFFKD